MVRQGQDPEKNAQLVYAVYLLEWSLHWRLCFFESEMCPDTEQKRLLPEGLALSMAGIMLASGIVAEALTVSAASVAHMAGGISGLVLVIVYALHGSLTAKSINP